MKILQTIYEFNNKQFDTKCGLYHVELDSGSKHYFIRNNESVGTITHYLDRPASECVSIIRNDVKQEFFDMLNKESNKK
jgi:hypothetical protein